MKSAFILFCKGMAMGAADVVPGVSGGTIAFISGIYDELVGTIGNLKPRLIRVLYTHGVTDFWKEMNGRFLAPLLLGIATSIISLAAVITHAIAHYPVPVWSFFFGLVIASVPLVLKQVEGGYRTLGRVMAFVIGAIGAAFISSLSAGAGSSGLLYIFLCAVVAICAMILPGISGSFILLLLGAYTPVLGSLNDFADAIKSADFATIKTAGMVVAVFLAGCVIGLVSFSNFLQWLLSKYRAITLMVLAGFLAGSLVKLWPWRVVTESLTKHEGSPEEELLVVSERLVLPSNFGAEPFVWQAFICCLAGVAIIRILDRFGPPATAND